MKKLTCTNRFWIAMKSYVELYDDLKSELEKELVQDVDIEGSETEGEVE